MIITVDTNRLKAQLARSLNSRMGRAAWLLALTGTPLLVYAAVSKPHTFTDGQAISAAQVNANFDTIYKGFNEAPLSGRVFTATQSGSLDATGANWRDLPGVSVTFSLPAATVLDLQADGSVTGLSGGGYNGGHCGFRFVVDGTAQGDPSWGDRIIGCPASSNSLGAWWCHWGMRRAVNVSAGNHTVKLQMTGWDSGGGCHSDGGGYSVAKLWVLAR